MLPLYQNTLKLIRSAFKYMRIFLEAVDLDINWTEMWKSCVLKLATDHL